ncbi:MAG: putative toxin-antitoxin system toxin component, PIN family [bacterium]
MKDRPKIVLDTNVLLVSISSRSKYHWIFQKLLDDTYDLYLSNAMLLEYEEIISGTFNPQVARDVIRALLMLSNVFQVDVYYEWNLIDADPDDNKFVDCAVSATVDYLVTNDKPFRIGQD